MDKKNIGLVLLSILLLGSILRVYGLGNESLWLDEAYTAEYTNNSISEIINGIYRNGTLYPQYFGKWAGSLPFYYITINIWTGLIGFTESNLRLFSAIFGIMSILLVYLLGKLLFNYKVGLIAAFILSINHQHIFFSQEARMYSMIVFLTILSVLFLIKSLSSNKNGYWACFVITNIILLYTHYFSFFILLFEAIYVLVYLIKNKKGYLKPIVSGIFILLLYLPWIPALISQISYKSPIGRYIGAPSVFDLARVLISINSWFSPNIETRAALSPLDINLIPLDGAFQILSTVLLTILFMFLFIISLKKIFYKNNKIFFLLLWFLIPLLTPFFISLIFPQNSVFSSIRYVISASPAYYLLVSSGVYNLNKWRNVFIIFIILFSIFPLYSYYTNFDMEQWREATDYLRENRRQDEPMFIQKANGILPLKYYYKLDSNVIPIDNIDEFLSNLHNKKSFWIVQSLEKYSDPQGLVKKYADANFKIAKQKEFIGLKIFYYSE